MRSGKLPQTKITTVGLQTFEFAGERNGAQGWNRTSDTAIFSRMLYQLSYLGGHRRRGPRASEAGCIVRAGGSMSSAVAADQVEEKRARHRDRSSSSSSSSLLDDRDRVAAGEPALQVDVGAALRAEGPVGGGGGLAAGRAWPRAACGIVLGWRAFIAAPFPIAASAHAALSQAEANRKALAVEERHRLVERQPDHVGIGADELHHEGAGKALDGVAAGLAAPFAGGEVAVELVARQALEAHPRLDEPLAEASLGVTRQIDV